jgi:hypothetical protein
MGNLFVEIPPPANWQDFEILTLDISRLLWKDDYAERNGRSGQEQKGVDVYGYNHGMKEHTGIQCKKRKRRLAGVEAPGHSLSVAEIDDEYSKCGSFSITLDRFIVASTSDRDEVLQDHVRLINDKGTAPKISLWFWDDYVERLNASDNLMYRYYQNILEYRKRYSADEHYFRMLAMAFDRPAIRTAFHLENRATDFITALSNLQEAISTGVLKDRDGRVIDQVRVPSKQPPQGRKIQALLQKARDAATAGIKSGAIRESGSVIEVQRQLADDLNKCRAEAVAFLNELLRDRGVEEVNFVEY